MQVFDTRHILSERDGFLSEVLALQTGLATERVKSLIEFGAVYFEEKRQMNDIPISKSTHLRIHCLPKKYSVHQINWAEVILENETDFLLVRKPSGIPVHPTVDNFHENVLVQLQNFLARPLYITQRLDTPTGGFFVIAKTKAFQAAFNELLAKKLVKKEYSARIPTEVKTGHYIHYLEPSPRSPKKMSESFQENWLSCELKITAIEKDGDFFQARIDLLTGRTHQIRAQMATIQNPLVGDTLYGSTFDPNLFLLESRRIVFDHPLTGKHHDFNL